ncbi:hypothetical protein ABZP36_035202 [Zizania latifolia]
MEEKNVAAAAGHPSSSSRPGCGNLPPLHPSSSSKSNVVGQSSTTFSSGRRLSSPSILQSQAPSARYSTGASYLGSGSGVGGFAATATPTAGGGISSASHAASSWRSLTSIASGSEGSRYHKPPPSSLAPWTPISTFGTGVSTCGQGVSLRRNNDSLGLGSGSWNHQPPPSSMALTAAAGGGRGSSSSNGGLLLLNSLGSGSSYYQMPPSPMDTKTGGGGGVAVGRSGSILVSQGISSSSSSLLPLPPSQLPSDRIKQAPNLGFMDNASQYMVADQPRVQWQGGYGDGDLAAVVANDKRSSASSLGMPPLQSQGSSNGSTAFFGSSSSRQYWNDDDELPPLPPSLPSASGMVQQEYIMLDDDDDLISSFIDLDDAHNSSACDMSSAPVIPLSPATYISGNVAGSSKLLESSSATNSGSLAINYKGKSPWNLGSESSLDVIESKPEVDMQVKLEIGITQAGDIKPKLLLPTSGPAAGADSRGNRSQDLSRRRSSGGGAASICAIYSCGLFSEEEKDTIVAEKSLSEIVLTDPKWVKKILRNRLSALRAKDRKMKQISDLEGTIQQLQKERDSFSNQVKSLQMTFTQLAALNSKLNAENSQLSAQNAELMKMLQQNWRGNH